MKRFTMGVGAAGILAAGITGVMVLGGAGKAAPAAVASPASAQADAYTIDSVHSFITFKIKHLNASYAYGRINSPSGTFALEEGGAIEVSAKTEDIDTGNGKRDQHLKGPDFFSAKEFPTLSFKSTSIKKAGDGFAVTGDLTAKGVTKPITVTLQKVGEGQGRGGVKLMGIEGTFTIKRSDFGISYMPEGLGDEVTLMIALEGGRK